MKHEWKNRKLGSFLTRADRFEERNDLAKYSFSGTYSYARGIFSSYSKNGSEFNLSKIQRIRKDDFVFCKIMAWEGAFGLVPEECDNTVMSGAFVAYEIDRSIIEPKFLDYFFKIESTWKKVGEKSSGTNVRRKTLFPDDFEKAEILLPPLPEQQRIVSKIESVKQRMEEIKVLREEQESDVKNLLFSIYEDAEENFDSVSLSSILRFSENWEAPIVNKIYRQMGIRVWGEGGYEREKIDGGQTAYSFFMRVEKDDLVINKIWVRNGASAVVTNELDGCFVSTEFPTFKYDQSILLPKWISFLVTQKKFWEKCSEKSFGTSGKNRIKPEEFLKVEIPLPPIEEQSKMIELLDKLNSVKSNHGETEKELEQLMPALLDKAFKGEL